MAWPTIHENSTILGDNGSPSQYQIIRQLGKGGYGQVYLVKDLKCNSFYAFKTPKSEECESDGVIKRFEKEAKTWINLEPDPNIVRAFHFFQFQNQANRPFISMEYIEGKSLKTILELQGFQLAVSQAAAYAAGVSAGMSKAVCGGKAVIHRDISEDNVLVCAKGNVPKVTDFGLSRPEGEKSTTVVRGKYQYIAPEVHGDDGYNLIGVRTDLYAFGVMAHRLLAGVRPVPINEKISVLPERFREWGYPLEPLRPLLSLIEACLNRDPEKRPGSWKEVHEQLRGISRTVQEIQDFEVCANPNCGFRFRKNFNTAVCPVCDRSRLVANGAGSSALEKWKEERRKARQSQAGWSDGAGTKRTRISWWSDDPLPAKEGNWESNNIGETSGSVQSAFSTPEAGASREREDSVAAKPEPLVESPLRSVSDLKAAALEAFSVRPVFESVYQQPCPGPNTPLPKFVDVPGGQCVLGAKPAVLRKLRERSEGFNVDSLSEPEERTADVPGFSISDRAVTQGEFEAFERETGYKSKRVPIITPELGTTGAAKLPAVGMLFRDAEAYCEWVGGRLPTPDEWEKAARGPQGWAYPWGDEFDPSACACEEGGAKWYVPVDEYPRGRSSYGLSNCVGNVGEMVDGGVNGRMLVRGGAFDDPCRFHGLAWSEAWRITLEARAGNIGFRAARDLNPPRLELFAPRLVQVAGKVALGCDYADLKRRFPHIGFPGWLREEPLREVELPPFEIGAYAVTNEEYWQFVQDSGHAAPSHWLDQTLSWTKRPFLARHARRPVVNVSYRDAQAYCEWLSRKDPSQRRYQLPTYEQRQAAARGREGFLYPWGREMRDEACNGLHARLSRIADVRAFAAGDSPFGCRQMSGNVFEWIAGSSDQSYCLCGSGFDRLTALYGMAFLKIKTPGPDHRDGVAGFRIVRISISS